MSTSWFVAWQVASFMKTEKQIPILLLNVDPPFTFRNNFPQLATNVFVVRQVDHARWKTANIDQKHATKQCCATSWGFLYLVFRRLYAAKIRESSYWQGVDLNIQRRRLGWVIAFPPPLPISPPPYTHTHFFRRFCPNLECFEINLNLNLNQ